MSTKGILEGEPADETILLIGHSAFQCGNVDDAAILLNVLGNSDASESQFKADYRSALAAIEEPRIGVVKNFTATDGVKAIFAKAV